MSLCSSVISRKLSDSIEVLRVWTGVSTAYMEYSCSNAACDEERDIGEDYDPQANCGQRKCELRLLASRKIGGLPGGMSYERQVLGGVRLGHERAVFAAG